MFYVERMNGLTKVQDMVISGTQSHLNHLSMKKALLLAFSAVCMSVMAIAQPKSPPATATGKIGDANITIKYSSPSVRGRQIWGTDLVPYGGKVWRAGANSATVFTTDKDITVGGKKLPAGSYSIYVIANPDEWVVIFNSQTGQWGITRQGETTLDPTKDVIRVNVKPVKKDTLQESLQYLIDANGFSLRWEYLDVPVSIKG